ncbi:MAG TPA: CPBP family intramembrane glutamic endopeptidase [Gaiellaceae bacterium]|nr:CPBP family intramembrane glutamic endopeptidase [Gaiellaceae bacterium]
METAAPRYPWPWRLGAWLGFVLVLTAVSFAGRLADGEPSRDAAYRYSTSVVALVTYAVLLGIVVLMAVGLRREEAFALRRPASWRRALAAVGIALIAIWAASAALAPFLDPTAEQGLIPEEWDPSRAGAFVAFFLVVTLAAPVVEELTYRGLGYTLLRPFGTRTAIVGTGVLFALAHGLLLGLPVLIVFGIAVGWVRARTESVYPGMLLHAVFNGVALLVSVAAAA